MPLTLLLGDKTSRSNSNIYWTLLLQDVESKMLRLLFAVFSLSVICFARLKKKILVEFCLQLLHEGLYYHQLVLSMQLAIAIVIIIIIIKLHTIIYALNLLC